MRWVAVAPAAPRLRRVRQVLVYRLRLRSTLITDMVLHRHRMIQLILQRWLPRIKMSASLPSPNPSISLTLATHAQGPGLHIKHHT